MTNDEISQIYLKSVGRKRIANGTIEVILPFLVLDRMWDIYTKEIAPIPCKQKLAKYKKQWSKSYTYFNGKFFKSLPDDVQDSVIDKMDEFEKFINNDIVIAKIALMNAMKEDTIEVQNVVASCLICCALCRVAHQIWAVIYCDEYGREEKNKLIDDIRFASTQFMDEYYKPTGHNFDSNADKNTNNAISILCNHIVDWCYKIDKQ